MAEKLKDAEDRMLESMFSSQAIADDGFSRRVVTRIRRRLWVQRLALPVALIVGSAIALKPALQLMQVAPRLLAIVPQRVLDVPASWLPLLDSSTFGTSFTQIIVLGAMLLAAAFLGIRLLEE
jgi:hypothetical protein